MYLSVKPKNSNSIQNKLQCTKIIFCNLTFMCQIFMIKHVDLAQQVAHLVKPNIFILRPELIKIE